MKFLIAHNSFLGQFEHFGKWLLDQGHDVVVVHRDHVRNPDPRFSRVQFQPFFHPMPESPYLVKEATNAIANAVGAANSLMSLRETGYIPDVMIAHCGWGTGLMLGNLWPESVYIAYHEWFYQQDPINSSEYIARINDQRDKTPKIEDVAHDLARNFPILAEFVNADACWCPNRFQASQFPPFFQNRIDVLHDGVDTKFFRPDSAARIDFDWLTLGETSKIVTYVGRGFEPIRGFPDFMKSIKLVQERLADVNFVIIGENRVAYGGQLPNGETWLHRMIDQLDIDMRRIHLTGRVSYNDYKRILQASTAHVYLTSPFVLSWSFSEALATGCNVIASDLPATREIVEHEKHATLVEPGNIEALANAIVAAVDNPRKFEQQRKRARRRMVSLFEAEKIFSKRLENIKGLIKRKNNSH